MRRLNNNVLIFAQFAVAALLIVLGLQEILEFNSMSDEWSRVFTEFSGNVRLVFGILELAGGIILLLVLFKTIRFHSILVLIVFTIWILRIIMYYFVTTNIFEAQFIDAAELLLKQGLIALLILSIMLKNKRHNKIMPLLKFN